jgi:hypothetical protein
MRSAVLSGHEDWVRSLAFQDPITPEDPLTLATASQDATIRLWKIEVFTRYNTSSLDAGSSDALSDDLLDAFEASLGDLTDSEEGGRQISLKRHILTVKSAQARSVASISCMLCLMTLPAVLRNIQSPLMLSWLDTKQALHLYHGDQPPSVQSPHFYLHPQIHP